MPVDPAMVDAMLGSFRDMLTGVQAQGASGADVDEMASTLAHMEALGQQLSDIGAFSTQLANDGYYQRFTDAYTRVMLAAAGASGTGAIPDDATLLTQALQAYENSLTQLRGMPDQIDAIAALERILAIGQSGVSYPVFLTQLEDEALNEVLAGSVTPAREHLVAALEQVRSSIDPAREAEAAALLAARDELAAASATGAVDPFAFELRRFRIAWEHAPVIARRDALVARQSRLMDLTVDWLDAHTTWAAHDKRFVGATPADTAKRIAMARECNPGFYAIRVQQFSEMFGDDPWWTRPEFAEERRGERILWTDARVQLAIDAVSACTPLASAPAELVARAEAFGPDSF